MRVPCLLPWLGLHVDQHGCMRPCAPETSRVALGYLDGQGVEPARSGTAAADLRHHMVTLQWPKTCRSICPVLQHQPIDLLASRPPAAEHPGTGGIALDPATWQRLRQGLLRDPDRAPTGLLSLVIEERGATPALAETSFASLGSLHLILDATAPLGARLCALVESIKKQAPNDLQITIECPAQCWDAHLASACLALEPSAITLALAGASARSLDRVAGRGTWQRVLANLAALVTTSRPGLMPTLQLEISTTTIDEIDAFFTLARDHGASATLVRSRRLLGREDPFALRSYRDLARLAQVLQESAARFMSVWEEQNRIAWAREPLLARTVEWPTYLVMPAPVKRARQKKTMARSAAPA